MMGAEESKQLKRNLSDLTVTHVEETFKVLGADSCKVMVVAKMGGLQCACKRLQRKCAQVPPWKSKKMADRFVKECKEMSKLHHPNIVQFLGVCFDHSPIPSLVMELLPTSLGVFLEEYDNVPSYVKHSILLDIAVALLYLHSHSPPIIHRDLTVNNVLLTHGLKTKISCPGVNVQSLLAVTPPTNFTSIPKTTLFPAGNCEHIPPEVRKKVPSYSTKLDIFSFGHLIIHLVLQKCLVIFDEFFFPDHPGPPDPQNKIYWTELDRRKKRIDEIEDTNPLKSLLVDCLQDDPDDRPTTCNVLTRLETINSHSPLPYLTPMDVLRALEGHSSEADNTDLKQTVVETHQQSPPVLLRPRKHNKMEARPQGEPVKLQPLEKDASTSTSASYSCEEQPLQSIIKSTGLYSQLRRPVPHPRTITGEKMDAQLPGEPIKFYVNLQPLASTIASVSASCEEQPLENISKSTALHSQLRHPVPHPRTITGKKNSILPKEQITRAVMKKPSETLDPRLMTLFKRQQKKIEENKPGDGIILLEASLTQR